MACLWRSTSVLVLCAFFFLASGFRIEITPRKYKLDSPGLVKIACILDAKDECIIKDVVELKVGKHGETPLAFVHKEAGFKYRSDSDDHKKYIMGQGDLGHHNSRSYLNVSLLAADNGDSGLYTCMMHYTDQTGMLREEQDSKTLTVDIYDVQSALEAMANTVSALQAKVTDLQDVQNALTLKNENQSHIILADKEALDMVTRRVDTLEDASRSQAHMMADLAHKDSLVGLNSRVSGLESTSRNQMSLLADVKDKVTYTVAFLAGLHDDVVVKTGQVVVFGNVKLNAGNAYNSESGVFTAPRNGLYSLQLALRTPCKTCHAHVHITANNDVVAGLDAGDADGWAQSSVSLVLEMEKGEQV